MISLRRTFYILIMLLAAALPTFAQEPTAPPRLEPMPPPGVFTNPQWMSIDYHRVEIDVQNQIAATNVNMQFTNNGDGFVEGTFLYPLPDNAAVDNLVMYINGEPIEAKLLRANEARAIYDEIVRQYRDPALLEYIGKNTIQANVFPIPPGESRRIEIGYGQILEADNGLVKLTYPMENTATTERPVNQMSLSVQVDSNDPVSNIYSPSHNIAVNRTDDNRFRVGFEQTDFTSTEDFILYYGLENESITLNALSYRESADEDGFFMMLVQPPITIAQDRIVPKDVILVIDQSGSMDGPKWTQAQSAATYVLNNLNPQDRFNVVVFSTGWRVFSNQLEPATTAPEAADWVNGMFAEGGTDINAALLEALRFADTERPTTILFLTDGLATEGVTETPNILDNIEAAADSTVRIFAFGVGDDVDTVLLDRLTQRFRGASSYVRPSESIDEEVSSLYNKVSSPVLTDVSLATGDVRTDFIYPSGQLPDLFAGEQLTIVGRYRQGADAVNVTLSGEVNGEPVEYTYENVTFRDNAGGDPFIARLWATRRIGDLLNNIRLNGESEELVNSVVNLSTRYGIITPYTSFLIEEDDILSQQGRLAAQDSFRADAEILQRGVSGADAVNAADAIGGMADASAPIAMPTQPANVSSSALAPSDDEAVFAGEAELAQTVPNAAAEPQPRILNAADKSFILQNGVYVDTTFDPDTMQTEPVVFLSDAYFDLIAANPMLADYFAVAERVIVVFEGIAYEVVPE